MPCLPLPSDLRQRANLTAFSRNALQIRARSWCAQSCNSVRGSANELASRVSHNRNLDSALIAPGLAVAHGCRWSPGSRPLQ